MTGLNTAGIPPDGGPDDLVRVLVAVALVAEFAALVSSSPAATMTAGLLAWTLRVLLDSR